MEDGLSIGTLPDWRYAGKPAEGVIAPPTRFENGQTIVQLYSYHKLSGSRKSYSYELREYTIENQIQDADGNITHHGYLIPRYPVQEKSYRRREEELLIDRVLRFFYSCEPGLDVERTGAQIQREIEIFNKSLTQIQEVRSEENKPQFDFSLDYRDMSREERLLCAQGSQFVGHAVNRLGRLGKIILQNNREGVKIEYNDDYVAKHMDAIKEEFKQLWITLAFNQAGLVRCVQTRDEKPDYDGVFADLIREIGKPVMAVIENANIEETATPATETNARQNIVTKIGYTLEAIDEVAQTMRGITHKQKFTMDPTRTSFVDYLEKARQKNDVPGGIQDLIPTEYRSLLEEYREVCRARACIKTDDADNFNPVAARLRFLKHELKLHHEALFKAASHSVSYGSSEKGYHDEKTERAITFLKRGVALMGEMAELRMPRNYRANDVYDRDAAEFKGRDASSVGRYKEEVQSFIATLPPEQEQFRNSGFAR